MKTKRGPTDDHHQTRSAKSMKYLFSKGHKINLGRILTTKRTGKNIFCEQCRKEVYIRKSKLNKINFCSRLCVQKYYKGENNTMHKMRGEKSPFWKGRNAGYAAKHLGLQEKYGKADKCENPLCQYKNPKRFHWANIKNHKYTRNREDYKMLCVSCHIKMDRKNLCYKGHELNKENTYHKKDGDRMCKICGLDRQRKWTENNREYYNRRHREYMKRKRALKICH